VPTCDEPVDPARGRASSDVKLRRVLVVSLAFNAVAAGALGLRAVRRLLAGSQAPPPLEPSATQTFLESPVQRDSTVFLGDSVTADAAWGEMFGNLLNRGVRGNTTQDVIDRLPEISGRKPRVVYLMIGINDLLRGATPAFVRQQVAEVHDRLRAASPETELNLVSVLPIREDEVAGDLRNQTILSLNQQLADLCSERRLRFIDAFSSLSDGRGELRKELTYDGLHLRPEGYWALRDAILAAGFRAPSH
jgi:lysophospholipase L1-like esterase